MGQILVEETDDFPNNEIPIRKKDSLVNNNTLEVETDLEFETNDGPKEKPLTPTVEIEDPMNELNSMNFLIRDPEEEFFMLAVLALKMLHNEEYDKSYYVCEISAGKLFKHVKDENLPFHRWYKWLEQKFEELRQAFIREAEAKVSDIERW